MKNAVVAVVGCIIALSASAAIAQDKKQAAMVGPMAVLKQMSDTLGSKAAISVTADASFDEKFEGQFVKTSIRYRIDIIRPNHLFFDAVFDDGAKWIGEYDGNRVRFYKPAVKEYSEIPFKGSLDAAIDYMDDEGLSKTPVNDFLRSNLFDAIKDGIYDAASLEDTLDPDKPDKRMQNLLFRSLGTFWQLWVRDDDTALPVKFNATYASEPGRPQYALAFRNWSFDGNLADMSSKYAVPSSLEGWKKVDYVNPINMR